MIFDTHAHYTDSKFDGDRFAILDALPKQGVIGVIECGCDIKSSKAAIRLAERYAYIHAACGIHPHDSGRAGEDDFAELSALLAHDKCVALGEIGLDYHYDFSPRETQREWFERQLILAKELDLPVIVHDRDAHMDVLALLKKYRPCGVMHCFSGSAETAREVLSLGMYIGLGGAVTFKNAKRPLEVAAMVPEDRLLLETDCPYMAPVPFRGRRCDSGMIKYTAETVAGVRGVTADEVLRSTAENSEAMYNV